MRKRERKEKKERIQFWDCYSLNHPGKGKLAVLQKRRKKVTVGLPEGVSEAIQLVKNQGFSLIEIV